MKTAVIYARYSSNSQTEQSIEGQLRVCHDYAVKNNIIILHEYIDRAMTGTNDKRPDFKKMIADSSKKQWECVLVYKFDRFSRNQYESVIHEYALEQNGVKLISATEPIPTESIGAFMKGMIISYNDFYSKELAEKVRRGMYESRVKGNFTGGVIPYGYKVENKKILIDEEKAMAVRYIFEQYACDRTVSEIISSMTAKGMLHDGKPFKNTAIYKMLKNERYIGIYKIKDELFPNMYPKMIDEKIFEKVQKKTMLNKLGSRSKQTTYLFKYKLTCGYCGKPISAETSRTRNNTKLDYYKCLGIKKYRNGCPKETDKKEVIEDFLLDAIISELEKPEIMKMIVKSVLDTQKELIGKNPIIDTLIKTKKQAQKSLDNLVQAIEQGVITKTTGQRIKELETQIEELEKQILIEDTKTEYMLTEEDVKAYYKTALKQEGIALISYLVKEIKLYNDKAEIIFNSPLKKSPNSDSYFLYRTKYMFKPVQHHLPLKIEMKVSYAV